MKVKDLIEKLNYKAYSDEICNEKEVSGVTMGDLLSYVMGTGIEGSVWVTVQAHLNVLAVASLREFPCIIVSNTNLEEEFLAKAKEENIAILFTTDSLYEISKKLVKLGL